MKIKKTHISLLFTIVLLVFNLSNLKAAYGDFGAWNLMSDHSGMNCGNVTFSEKELTVEFWIYISELDGRNIDGTTIISNRHDGNHGFTVSLNKNSNNLNKIDLRFWFKTVNESIYAFWMPREVFVNKWNHVAFVISSKDKRALAYLNSELYGNPIENINGDWKGNIKPDGRNVGDLWLAAWYTSPKFYGKMADIRVWNVARTPNELKENSNKVLTGKESGLQKYYTFSDEVFAQKPFKFEIQNGNLTWSAIGESWDIEVRSKTDNSLIRSETVTEKSYSIVDLDPEQIVYVRTYNNGFYSGWAYKSDIIKVGCVGDSNTYGAEATDRLKYAWPVQIREMLGGKYETQNFGVNGALMMDHLNDAWKNKTAYTQNKAYDPDIIVIALGTNDSKDGYWDAVKFKNSYINLITEFKSYPANPQIYMALPIKAYSLSWSINDATIREKVIPVMKDVSKEMGLPLIDLYSVTENISDLMAADGIHPRDEGLGIMARKIADIMQYRKPSITINGAVPTTFYDAYYWYKNDTLIENANEATYTVVDAGSYKVAVKLSKSTNDVVVSESVDITEANSVLVATNTLTSVPTSKSNNLEIKSFSDYIQIKNGAGSVISIYNIRGQLINTQRQIEDDSLIGTSHLSQGIYICKVQKGENVLAVKLFK